MLEIGLSEQLHLLYIPEQQHPIAKITVGSHNELAFLKRPVTLVVFAQDGRRLDHIVKLVHHRLKHAKRDLGINNGVAPDNLHFVGEVILVIGKVFCQSLGVGHHSFRGLNVFFRTFFLNLRRQSD